MLLQAPHFNDLATPAMLLESVLDFIFPIDHFSDFGDRVHTTWVSLSSISTKHYVMFCLGIKSLVHYHEFVFISL